MKDRDIFLVGGPGGVGKTTLAAALAVELSVAGFSTIVLTVDPARRLAQALGFSNGFNAEVQEVKLPGHEGAKLFASMLDTKRYFDRIIEKFAKSPEQRERILKNPLYQDTIAHLGGTHEYAAMERLLEFAASGRYQKIVVDTPPSQNAVDLLSAPQRLADFMDNSVLRWFQGSAPMYLQIFRQGTKLAMKMVQKVFGAQFMDTISRFFDDLDGMQAGFRERNLQVIELLKSPKTAFCLVTYPSEIRFLESMSFLQTLREKNIPLRAVMLNRIEPRYEVPAAAAEETKQLVSYYHALYQLQHEWIEKFKTNLSTIPLDLVEKEESPPLDLPALEKLGKKVFS